MPYLSINEQATYIDVACDGYGLRFYTNTSYDYLLIYDPTFSTLWGRDYCNVSWDDGAVEVYELMDDPNTIYTIMEDTPTRVILKIVGNFYDSVGTSYITNSTGVEVTYSIYSDRFTKRVLWERSGSITIATQSNEFWNALASIYGESGLTNEDGYYESSGSEVDGADGIYNSADYLAIISEEFNGQMITLYTNDSTNYDQFLFNGISPLGIFQTCTLSGSGTLELIVMCIIDSVDRADITPTTAWATSTLYYVGDLVVESSVGYECITQHTSGTFSTDYASGYWKQCHKYTVADRLIMGNQYRDTEL